MIRLLLVLLLIAGPASAQVPRAAEQYRLAVISSAASTFGPAAPVAMLAAQLHVESAWRADAVSPAKAQGLAQFIPSTAAGLARIYPDLRPPLPFDPSWSIRARDRLMAENRHRYQPGRSACSGWVLGLVAYNGGLAALDREIALCRATSGCDPARWYANVELQRSRAGWAWTESRAYPDRILATQVRYASWGPRACVAP